MERVCWVDGDGSTDRVGKYNSDCENIPYVLAVDADERPLTASVLEAHRLASPYVWTGNVLGVNDGTITFSDHLKRRFELSENRLVPWKKVAEQLLEIDPGSLLHGIWFNDSDFSGGKVRLTRALTGYIEAASPEVANFGFQKRDPVSDRTDVETGQTAAEGYGSVIGPKQHFTSPSVKAYFQLDLERLRSYGLADEQVRALTAWSIYKIRRVLAASRDGVADLRTECKFEPVDGGIKGWTVQRDRTNRTDYALPEIDEDLKNAFASLKRSNGAVLRVRWIPKIEGRAELEEGMKAEDIKRVGLESKSKVETPAKKKKTQQQPKPHLILFGEWKAADKESLRTQNPGTPASGVVQKAIKSYEKAWDAKAKGEKVEDDTEQEKQE
jgi:CRISPR-associated protein Csb1